MIRVIVKVKDKGQAENLKNFGSIVYKSPVLNIIAMEIRKDFLEELRKDKNVLSCEIEPEGSLMLA